MSFKKTSMALIASTLLVTTLSARDQIKIVGSSTVYPFSSSVAEEFGLQHLFQHQLLNQQEQVEE